MRFGIGGERFRLRAGPVSMTFGGTGPAAPGLMLLMFAGQVLVMGGAVLAVEAPDE